MPRAQARGRVKVVVILVVVALIAVGLGWAFARGRGELASEQAREAAIAPPRRVHEEGGVALVTLDSATLRRAGVRTVTIGSATRGALDVLTGELVQDPGAVTVIRAPIQGRLMNVPGGRWPSIGERVAAGEVLARVADALPLTAARAGTVTSVAAYPGEIVQAGQELLTLTAFEHPLARISWTTGAPPAPPRQITVTAVGGTGGSIVATLVGAAPAADTVTGAPAFLYRMAGAWAGARPGLPILAAVPDSRRMRSGMFVPDSATVQWNGLVWAYVERGPGRFGRVRIETSNPVPGGWLVSGGVAPGDRVVVRGTEQLLSEEFRSGVSGDAGD